MTQVQGQRSPNKTVGEVKSRLESNPKPTRHSEGSNKTLSAPGSWDPTRNWARSAFECLSVSCRHTSQLWSAARTGALATADLGGVVCGTVLLKRVAIVTTTLPQFGLKPNYKEGTQPHLSTENWITDYWAWTLPIKARPRFPHSQSLPSGSFRKSLILIYQRTGKMKTTITENYPNCSHGSLPCLTQWNYEPCHAGPPKTDRSQWSSDETWSTGEGNGKPLQYSCLENPWTIWKGKRI